MPSSLAAAVCCTRNSTKDDFRMQVASRISPYCNGKASFKTVTIPSVAVCSIFTEVASARVTDFSFEAKSFAPMVATLVWESEVQVPIE